MAKRFTDTDLFKKKFIRGLQGAYKLLWIYIYHDCNHAGIWETDFEVASIKIGLDITEEGAIKEFNNKIILIDNGEKWFIPSFIEFQYGKLNPDNRAHNSVIQILSKYKIDYEKLIIKGHTSPLQGGKDKDMDKDMDKDKEKNKNNGKHLFSNSKYYDFDKFIIEIESNDKYLPFDCEYYHECLINWSAEGNMKKDWIATARNWMLRDVKDSKPKLKNEYQQKFKQDGKQSYEDKLSEYLNRKRDY